MKKFFELNCIVSHKTAPQDEFVEEITDEEVLNLWWGDDERDSKIYLRPVCFHIDCIESIWPTHLAGITYITTLKGDRSVVAKSYEALKKELTDL